MKNLKQILPYLLLLIVCLAVAYWLYPKTHPFAGLSLKTDRDFIEKRANQIADDFNIVRLDFYHTTRLQQREPLIQYVQKQFGLERANEILRQDIGGYYYNVGWGKSSLYFKSDSALEGAGIKNMQLSLDLQGRLLEMERSVPDTLPEPALSRAEALQVAQNFLKNYSSYRDVSEDSASLRKIRTGKLNGRSEKMELMAQMHNRLDHEFAFRGQIALIEKSYALHVGVAGNSVSFLRIHYDLPHYEDEKTLSIVLEVSGILIMCVITIIALFFMFKRYRAYELGFRLAITVGVFGALVYALAAYTQLPDQIGWQTLILVGLIPLFYGVGIFMFWALSESISRDLWQEKFISFDLLAKGHITHSFIGRNMMSGMALGSLAFALLLIMLRVVSAFTNLNFIFKSNEALHFLDASNPAIFLFGGKVAASLYILSIMIILLTSFLRKYLSNTPLFILLAAIVYTSVMDHNIQPPGFGLPISLILAVLFIWSFIKFESLTAYLALTTFALLNNGLCLLFVNDTTALHSGHLLFGGLMATIFYSGYTCLTRDSITDFKEITPVFVRYINERQRLQKELEIAREVQMSFLPRQMPEFEGLDIAARCLPAYEVGGDYYDFIDLGNNKFGIAIGDVSGKGAQAAFYMTLAKGFLQAVARDFPSASEVLKRMNRLFYENARRNTFITLIYGIFDLEKMKLQIARAGHDLVIIRRAQTGDVQELHSPGLALGLEKGDKFEQIIKEVQADLHPGEAYVFYTDGLTEARNKAGEEFGLGRLMKIISDNGQSLSEKLLDKIYTEVKDFCGRAEQHDDLSVVVVKVK